jgi:hypothetical protein
MATRPSVPWFEVHAENHFGGGGAVRRLEAVRRDYPIAVHGVGLSLGSADGLDERHLGRLAALVARIDPVLVSEHLSWSVSDGAYLNHLLPLPYTPETLEIVCRHVERMQNVLGRGVLIENPSSYLRFRASTIPEPEFLGEVTRRTGCGLLLDVNNVYVSCCNLEMDPPGYLAALPATAVGEIHLAGHTANDADGRPVLIDDHGSRVAEAVWHLYAAALARFGPVPTLIEWDTDLPPLAVLREEAQRADTLAATASTHDADAA